MRLLLGVPDVRGLHGNLDTTPPSIPAVNAPTSVTDTTATITWTASTDNVAVDGYNVYLVPPNTGGGTPPAPVLLGSTDAVTLTFNLTGLRQNSDNTIGVTAFDTATTPNESDMGLVIVSTAATTDTTAPTVPANLVAGVITNSTIAVSWDNSSDSQSGVDHYEVYVNAVLFTTVINPNVVIGGLTPSTSYSITVKAVDGAATPNTSAASTALMKSTLAGVGGNVAVRDVAYAQTTAGTNPVLTIPNTIMAGDQMIILVGTANGETQAAPSGWARPVAPVTNVNMASCLLTKTAAGTAGTASSDRGALVELALTAGSQKNQLTFVAFYNQATSSPLTIATPTTDASAVTAHTLPSLTTTVAGSAIIGLIQARDGATNNTGYTPPSGWTSPTGFHTTGGTNPQTSYIAVNPNPEPIGTYAADVLTGAVAEQHTVMWHIAIAPSSAPVDNTDPSQVTGLAPTTVTTNSIGLSWNAATDDSGTIATYNIYWNAGVGSTAGTILHKNAGTDLTYTAAGLTPGTTYAFAVSAVDPSLNEGAKSDTIRPSTSTGGGGTSGVLFMLQGTNQHDKSTGNPSLCRLGDRTAANGWSSSSGGVLVDSSGNSVGLGGVRGYYTPGSFPAAFDTGIGTGGFGTNTHKRVQVCFKGNTGWTNFSAWITQAIDLPFCRFINSIPEGWEVGLTPHHEPQDDFDTTNNTTAQFKAGMMRFAALLEGRAMPAGQPVKDPSAPAVALKAGVTAYMEICFTLPPSATTNQWPTMKNALPNASQMDAGAKVCLDAYQNPPPAIGAALPAGGVNALYPTPQTVWNFFFSNILSQYGYDAPGHGYTVGEWMAPARDNDNSSHAGQTNAVTSYLSFLINHDPPPYAIRMWEDKFSITDGSGAQFNQTAFAGAKQAFCNAALGANART